MRIKQSRMRPWVAAALAALALSSLPRLAVAQGVYCDQPKPALDCLDPALNPNGPMGAGNISPDLDLNIKPGEPIAIADHSPFDGIYQCVVKDTWSANPATTFASVNGHPSGDMIFMLASLDPNTDRYAGYGKGKFDGDALSGLTNYQGAFSLKVSESVLPDGTAQVTMVGKIRVKLRATPTNGQPSEGDASVSCTSLW